MAKLFIEDASIRGKRVLVRVDFNVPIKDGKIESDKRLRESLRTLNYCLAQGASLVLMSHLGRPDGKRVEKHSLRPVAARLQELLGRPVKFLEDCDRTRSGKKPARLCSPAKWCYLKTCASIWKKKARSRTRTDPRLWPTRKR